MTPRYTLYSGHVCPFAQRVAIVAAELGIACEKVIVDLADKPDWFLAISPAGKIPVLQFGDEALFESIVIAEYLEEVAGPALHAADPIVKARHRGWMEYANLVHGGTAMMVLSTEQDAFDRGIAEVRRRLAVLEAAVVGPYFAGDRFHLVDAIYAPLLRGMALYESLGGFGLFEGMPNIAAWWSSLQERPSVVSSAAPDYRERTVSLIETRNGPFAKAMLQKA